MKCYAMDVVSLGKVREGNLLSMGVYVEYMCIASHAINTASGSRVLVKMASKFVHIAPSNSFLKK